MDQAQDHELPGDLSALAWVQDELRRTLDNAHKALRRHLRSLESTTGDEGGGAPTALLQARGLIHQGVGALELIGVAAPARLLRGSEQALQRLSQGQAVFDLAAVQTLERVSFAVLDYLRRQLAGKPASELSLFPQYRDVLVLAGAERVHPADLWSDTPALLLPSDNAPSALPEAQIRQAIEARLLKYFRGDAAASRRIGERFGQLADAGHGRLAQLWALAAAFFEAQAQGLLPADLYAKRMASRLLAQLRAAERGQTEVPDRLLQDLLFFCARARPAANAPRLAAVVLGHHLQALPEVDYEQSPLGRYDPALVPVARRRVAALKDTWSAVAAGELAAMPGIPEQSTLVADSIHQIYPDGARLAQALQSALESTVRRGEAPRPELAMEVATTLLCLDASLDEVDPDQPELQQRIQRLADRLEAASKGLPAAPLEHWVEDLYRDVSDRQSMGSVVQELRASLAEIEQQLDRFNREPEQGDVLLGVPGQLGAMRGVLSVLGLDQAAQAVQRMRDDVHAVIDQRADAAKATEELADNLGALSFLIDMLGVQPQLAKSLFRFDADTGRFSALMGRARSAAAEPAVEPRLADQLQTLARDAAKDELSNEDLGRHLEGLADQAVAADQPSLAVAATQARQALAKAQDAVEEEAARADVVQALSDLAAASQPPAEASVSRPMPLDDDDDMQAVFIEEAQEVIEQAGEALARLAREPQDLEAMTAVRRAFHTLKGSSRMVGLKAYGDAAWACEQLFNARLADAVVQADLPLQNFTAQALAELRQWVEAIAAGQAPADVGPALIAAALALRQAQVAPLQSTEPPLPQWDAPAFDEADAESIPVAELLPEPLSDDALPALQVGEVSGFEPIDSLPGELLPAGDAMPVPDHVWDGDVLPEAQPPALSEALAASGDWLPEAEAEPELDADDDAPLPMGEVIAHGPSDLTELDLPDLNLDALEGDAAPADWAQQTAPLEPQASLPDSFEPQAVADVPEALELPGLPVWAPAELTQPFEPVELPVLDQALDAPLMDAGLDAEHLDLPLPEFSDPSQAPLVDTEAVQAISLLEGDVIEPPLPPAAAEDDYAPNDWPETTHQAGGDLRLPEVDLELDLEDATTTAQPLQAQPEPVPQAPVDDAERYKVVGPLRIPITLFNIFLNEADEQSRRLTVALAEWQHELHRPVGDTAVALAHSLAGNSATVGYQDLSSLAHRLEHALERSCARGMGHEAEAALYLDVADEIRRLLHQFAAGFLKPVPFELLERLDRHEEADALQHNSRAAELESQSGMVQAVEDEEQDQDEPDDGFGGSVTQMASLNPLGEVRFSALEPLATEPAPETHAAPSRGESERLGATASLAEDLDARDAIDDELFEIFVEEGEELLPVLAEQIRQWERQPDDLDAGVGALRALHTFKGGARLAGAMRLGELAHRLETAIERLTVRGGADAAVLAQLHQGVDALNEEFQRLRQGGGAAVPGDGMSRHMGDTEMQAMGFANTTNRPHELAPLRGDALTFQAPQQHFVSEQPMQAAEPAIELAAGAPVAEASSQLPAVMQVDWQRLARRTGLREGVQAALPVEQASAGSVRVRAPLLDRMVSHAGEVGIARARIESDMGQMQLGLKELTDNLERLRRQLRDLELQAETQMATRMEAARHSKQDFDPLEMDRFTRVQELTRMMAESVNDVGTVQRGLQQTLQDTEDQLAVQARLNRDLQDDLLRARMVEFDTLSDRLYRVVRQAAKESGKQVRLNLQGGGIELDRAVLDRMAPPFEHLLRNAVVHGIESGSLREAMGKSASGTIDVTLRQAGNEVQIEVRDDGAGLNLARIAERATAMGLLNEHSRPTEAELAGLIFTPGFSTADQVTELAGRGIGMDVVRSEVTAMGGRIETASSSGQGTAFRMVLPLTTAVTQVVVVHSGAQTVALPSTLVDMVRRVPAAEVEAAYQTGLLRHGEVDVPFFWLGSLLQQSLRGPVEGKSLPVVVVRSAAQLVAVHVSQVVANQEVVVKNLGPQLSRLPGLAGMSLLPTGDTVLIYNPVALTAVYGAEVRQRLLAAPTDAATHAVLPEVVEPVRLAPLVMVVDDSLTVRRVTQRLLQREGYRVVLAKDGLDALEKLADETPAVMLCDIEMPRMDGFDLVHNVRSDPRLAKLPVVMITSRIADKHQEHARELGVNHYLGKPYDEDLLLSLVRDYAGETAAA
ncbi:MAG TPA: Hpt domain-containing protein [Ideonella sp.]|uniref:Hpt domain-containing protein n=1 Tax=Ideonella sp. TaxID=1929293 RepID=UPI002CABD6B2|nr:Hpt domain-containing protein [Ideonella sp.]HSI48352.1 Hpt domain-containing protein [Ideonella sp.]